MSSATTRMISRLLIALMVWMPIHVAQAGVISTEQAISSVTQSDRAAVLGIVSRSDVASQLQALGIDPASAKDRVAAMTDEEIHSLAGKIDSLPAGARGSGWGWALVIVIAIVLWYNWK